jgi:hypothetical protein
MMIPRPLIATAAACAAAVAVTAVLAQAPAFAPTTRNFPLAGGNLANQRHSALKRITPANVSKLGGAWMVHLEEGPVPQEPTQRTAKTQLFPIGDTVVPSCLEPGSVAADDAAGRRTTRRPRRTAIIGTVALRRPEPDTAPATDGIITSCPSSAERQGDPSPGAVSRRIWKPIATTSNSGPGFHPLNASCMRGACRWNCGNLLATHPMNPDFVDLLRALRAADARFLIVGAYALAHHGRPRGTGDLDLWIDATPANAPRVMQALASFGAPLDEVTEQDFSRPGVVFQIGVPPGRIDVLTELTGITFDEAWATREPGQFGDIVVDFLGREAFIRNKRATGRAKDLGDIEGL